MIVGKREDATDCVSRDLWKMREKINKEMDSKMRKDIKEG